jgi:glycosyltransferase involved in cell wall biosynthesis
MNDKKLRVLFIGRIAEEKGIEDLLVAIHKMTKILNDRNDLELVCIGPDYGHSQEIHSAINNLKLKDMVRMLGPLHEDEKLDYLSWCDVLVLPSHFEAFGLPVLEAMARGKPVVATKTIGTSSLIKHEETGFLVRVGDSDRIAYSLLRLLEYPELKYQMGDRALKHAFKFSMERMIQDHIILYQRLLCEKS